MAAWQVFTATLAMLAIMSVTIVSLQPRRDPDRLSVDRIRERIINERSASPADSPAALSDPATWSHQAPDHELTVQEAHRTMQRHRDCPVAECPRKASAFRVLVDAGRIKPCRMPPALQ
ncbi:hypothetical protein JK358_23790 [Nocardia sp. 2]|uniref:Uncharacterized protein n=1 Tax=Nocardia acididurans TaxID=2802282 RepID=A0ABS1MBP5_9NOCA|nr:hypothetical protein [Nocardia acididurans]MBL1077430.1 hypothetical protein [Nocardia acididurans]